MEEIQTPARPEPQHFILKSSKSDVWETQAVDIAQSTILSGSLTGKFSPHGSCWIHLDDPDYDLLHKTCHDLKLSSRLTASVLTSLKNRGVRFLFSECPKDTASSKEETVLAKEHTHTLDTFDSCSPRTVHDQAICFHVASVRIVRATNADGCLWFIPCGPKTLVSIYIAGQAPAMELDQKPVFQSVSSLLRDLLAGPVIATSIYESPTIIQQECREDRNLILYQLLHGIFISLARRLGRLSGTGPGRFKPAITEFKRITSVLKDIQSGQRSNESLISTICSQYINTLIGRIELDIVPMLADAVEAKHENNLPDILKSPPVPGEPIPSPLDLVTFLVSIIKDTPALWPYLAICLSPAAILTVLANWPRLECMFNSMFNDPELPNPFSAVFVILRFIKGWPALWPWVAMALIPCVLLFVDWYRTGNKSIEKTEPVKQ